MQLFPAHAMPVLLAAVALCLTPSRVAAQSYDELTLLPPGAEDPCADLDGAPYGLCNAFCNVQNCDEHPRLVCDVLRLVYERRTGHAIFPCEEEEEEETPTPTFLSDTPTFTPTFTPLPDTPTATPPVGVTDTPTPTLAVPTGTATAVATPTETFA